MRRILAMVFGVLVVVGVLGVLPALANAAEQNVLSIPGAANTMVLSDLGKKTAAVFNFVSDGSSFTKALLWKSAKGKFDARRAKVTAGDNKSGLKYEEFLKVFVQVVSPENISAEVYVQTDKKVKGEQDYREKYQFFNNRDNNIYWWHWWSGCWIF